MSLQLWLPLNGDLHNQGLLGNVTPTCLASGHKFESGKFGQCVKNGVIYHLNEDPIQGNEISVCVWIKKSSYGTGNYIIASANDGSNTTTKFYFSVQTGANLNIGLNTTVEYTVPYNFQTNIWYHVCFTYNGNTIKLYLNGELLGLRTSNKTLRQVRNYAISGRANNAEGTALVNDDFNVNDFRLYDHCLSAKEVELISRGMLLHYPLNTTDVVDVSGFKNNANNISNLTLSSNSPRYSNCCSFNNSVIDTNGLSTAETYNLWAKFDSNNPANYSILFIDGSSKLALGRTSSKKILVGTAYQNTKQLPNNFNLSDWHMYTVVKKNDTENDLYVDGVLCENASSVDAWIYSKNTLTIGKRNNGEDLCGKISDFRVYATKLSQEAITELYKTSVMFNKDCVFSYDVKENLNIFTSENVQKSPHKGNASLSDRWYGEIVERNGVQAMCISHYCFTVAGSREILKGLYDPNKQLLFDLYMDTDASQSVSVGLYVEYTDGTTGLFWKRKNLDNVGAFDHNIWITEAGKTIEGIYVYHNTNTPTYYRLDSKIVEYDVSDMNKQGVIGNKLLVESPINKVILEADKITANNFIEI